MTFCGCARQSVAVQKYQAQRLSKSSGFTLIELIAVIVILGVLAATALPRFVDLSGDAEKAVVESTVGALASAKALYIAKALVCGSTYANITSPPLAFAVAVTSSDAVSCQGTYAPSGHSFDGNQIRNGLMSTPSADIFKDNLDNGNVLEFDTKSGRRVTITNNQATGSITWEAVPPY